jgi:hypothetical protein
LSFVFFGRILLSIGSITGSPTALCIGHSHFRRNKMMKSIRAPSVAACVVGLLTGIAMRPALAWDGAVSGTIAQMDVTNGNNQGLRVYLAGTSTMCNGGASWAYLNDTDSNYKTYAAALLMAKAQGTTVHIYSNLEGGYCHIGYITLTSG